MDRQSTTDGSNGLRSALRLGAASVALGLSVPLYYGLVALAPSITTVVPPAVPLGALGVGLFVTFPAMVVRSDSSHVTSGDGSLPEYGVDDRWERRNL